MAATAKPMTTPPPPRDAEETISGTHEAGTTMVTAMPETVMYAKAATADAFATARVARSDLRSSTLQERVG